MYILCTLVYGRNMRKPKIDLPQTSTGHKGHYYTPGMKVGTFALFGVSALTHGIGILSLIVALVVMVIVDVLFGVTSESEEVVKTRKTYRHVSREDPRRR